jgi:competence ComEA-like helix-hairpin-helix protein
MGIADRDYMRRTPPPFGRKPWWKRIKLMPAVGAATALLGLGSAAVWFMRDAGGLFQGSGPAEGSLRVNVNTATLAELESVPGIGEALARQIVARRPYNSVDQLMEISGIGPQSLEGLRPFVKVEGETDKLR